DHAEPRARAFARAVDRLRQREAVRVVRDAYRPLERALEIFLERPADEPGGVRVLDAPGDERERARNTDANGAGPCVARERRHGGERRLVVTARCWHALAESLAAMRESNRLDLRAAEVHTDARQILLAHCPPLAIGPSLSGNIPAGAQHRHGSVSTAAPAPCALVAPLVFCA